MGGVKKQKKEMKINIFLFFAVFTALLAVQSSSCVTSNAVSGKLGVQLWGENCNRCHNIASPNEFNDVQWAKVGTHMKIRANLTEEEVKKIVEFMQSAN